MHLQTMIVRTWRRYLSEFGHRDRVRLDEYLEAVDVRRAGCCESIHQLVNLQQWECDKVTLPLSSHGVLADGGPSCREARRKLKLRTRVNS